MTEQEIIELRESQSKSKLSVNDFGSKKTNWNDKSIFEYFKDATKEQIQELVKELNTINNVKICGFFGQCFNCRNKHINIEDTLDRPPIWDEGYTTGEATNSVQFNAS